MAWPPAHAPRRGAGRIRTGAQPVGDAGGHQGLRRGGSSVRRQGPAMRRTIGVAAAAVILLCLGATTAMSVAAGVGVGHRLQVRYGTVRVGQVEPFREEAKNDGPSPIQATVFGVITFPCGGWRDIDPLAQVVAPNGGTAEWKVFFQ